MRGHTNNVSCVLFHPKHELIISNSEDRTIRVWDISKRLGVQTFRRDTDRFWILAAHPDQNLLAAGHDSGLTVFKLERERPAFYSNGETRCFYVKERYLRLHEFGSNRDIPLVSLRRATTTTTAGIGGGPRILHYNVLNKSENNVLILSDSDNSYELVTFSTDLARTGEAQDIRRGYGIAVFVARDRFVFLNTIKQLVLMNFENVVVKVIPSPLVGIDNLFYGGASGRVLLKAEDRVVLFDILARRVIAELHVPRIKYVVWNKDYSLVALFSKHQVALATKNLEQLCVVGETVNLKGGCWDDSLPIFVYTTLNHVKYVLPSGDRGIIRGLDAPVYVTKVTGTSLHCIDREVRTRVLEIDTTEAQFKLALEKKDYPAVIKMVKHSHLCGQAVISYLQEKGYPEVALNFVRDPKTRFKLAIACGNIEIAMSIAYDLGDDAWKQLGTEALRQGNHEVVEMAYQKTKEFEKLSFLYLITGNVEKLRKMLKIAEMRGDVMSRFHNALYLGDADERMKVFEATGQVSLAYLTAATHGLVEHAERLHALLTANSIPIPRVNTHTATLLQPPTPIMRGENWPLLAVSKSTLADVDSESPVDEDEAPEPGGDWAGDDDLFDDEEEGKGKPAEAPAAAKGAAWDDDDLDLSDDEAPAPVARAGGAKASGIVYTAGVSPISAWCSDSSLAADHMAAGSVDSSLQLLNRQIAAVNVSVLRSNAIATFLGASAYLPGLPLTPSSKTYLMRDPTTKGKGKPMPAVCMKLAPLLEQLKLAYRAFTAGQFGECKSSLEQILHSIPLVVVPSRTASNEIKELLEVCREYLIAIRVKTAMGETEDVPRSLELAAYFTHCNLQPSHLMLALKSAMATAFKNKVTSPALLLSLTASLRTLSTLRLSLAACWSSPTPAPRSTQTPGPRHRKFSRRASSRGATSTPSTTTR
jgi:coatomer subunit alpha